MGKMYGTKPRSNPNWETPQFLFEKIIKILSSELDINREEMIDLACNGKNQKCDRYFTEQQNSLAIDWHNHGQWGWLAPPSSGKCRNIKGSLPILFVNKAVEESKYGFKTIALLEQKGGEPWHFNLIGLNPYVDFIKIIGRMPFVGTKRTGTFNSGIALFGVKKGYLSEKQNIKDQFESLLVYKHRDFFKWKKDFSCFDGIQKNVLSPDDCLIRS
jgi:hypothetical protein